MNTAELRLSLWNAQAFRLTAFHSADAPIDIDSWWSNSLGQVPEFRVARPKEGVDEVAGPIPNPEISPGKLRLRSQPSRIDWTMQADEPIPPTSEIPSLGRLTAVLPIFTDIVGTWLDGLPFPLTRLALGSILLLPVENQQQGYSILSGFLPFSLDPNSADFLYRINRPVPSRSLEDGTVINRLSSWSVLQTQLVGFSVSLGMTQPEPLSSQPLSSFACRLESDINTQASRTTPLPSDKYAALLAELSELTLCLAEQGVGS